jgi:hypothetical protein
MYILWEECDDADIYLRETDDSSDNYYTWTDMCNMIVCVS